MRQRWVVLILILTLLPLPALAAREVPRDDGGVAGWAAALTTSSAWNVAADWLATLWPEEDGVSDPQPLGPQDESEATEPPPSDGEDHGWADPDG